MLTNKELRAIKPSTRDELLEMSDRASRQATQARGALHRTRRDWLLDVFGRLDDRKRERLIACARHLEGADENDDDGACDICGTAQVI